MTKQSPNRHYHLVIARNKVTKQSPNDSLRTMRLPRCARNDGPIEAISSPDPTPLPHRHYHLVIARNKVTKQSPNDSLRTMRLPRCARNDGPIEAISSPDPTPLPHRHYHLVIARNKVTKQSPNRHYHLVIARNKVTKQSPNDSLRTMRLPRCARNDGLLSAPPVFRHIDIYFPTSTSLFKAYQFTPPPACKSFVKVPPAVLPKPVYNRATRTPRIKRTFRQTRRR